MKNFLSIFIGWCLPATALAVSITDYGWSCNGFLYCGQGRDAVQIVTSNITIGVVSTISALAVIVILYGAIRMAASQGGEGKDAGKKAILWALAGLAIAILTGGIILFVQEFISAVAS